MGMERAVIDVCTDRVINEDLILADLRAACELTHSGLRASSEAS